MAGPDDFDDEPRGPLAWLRWAALAAIVLVGGYFIVAWLNAGPDSTKKPAPPTTTAVLLPPPSPPPPPPPPPPEQPPEPVEQKLPEDIPEPTPQEQQQAEAPAAVSIDAAATGAGDAFGLKGGGPGGMGAPGSTGTNLGAATVGGGISDQFYGRNLSAALQRRVQDEGRVNRQQFTADFNIWIDSGGRVTRAALVRSSGDEKRDQVLLAVLEGAAGLDPPPASIRFPQKISVRGRRSSL